jgi:hypothetical protein
VKTWEIVLLVVLIGLSVGKAVFFYVAVSGVLELQVRREWRRWR